MLSVKYLSLASILFSLVLFARASTLGGRPDSQADYVSLNGGAGGLFDTSVSRTSLNSAGFISETSPGDVFAGALATYNPATGWDPISGTTYSASSNDYDWMLGSSDYAALAGLSSSELAAITRGIEQGYIEAVTGEDEVAPMQLVSDPVDSVSGAFLVDEVDLSLKGPFPIEIRRTYNSQNGAFGLFGYGWKLNTMPYIVVLKATSGTKDSIITAAELDGTVVEYVKDVTAGASTWRASNKLRSEEVVNAHFSNFTSTGAGSTSNLLSQRIEFTAKSSSTLDPWITSGTRPQRDLYTVFGADGSQRQYYERDFPYGSDATAVKRLRPYLYRWTDANGNFLTFYYGMDKSNWDYGQLVKIVSSNGAFVSFDYNSPGQIVAAFTNDGRRLAYRYDEFGDLVSVTLPDGAVHRYTYKHSTIDPADSSVVVAEYSTHLINRVRKPEGRTLENDYDDRGRVTKQRATVGQGLELVRNATFVYSHPSDPAAALTGWTRVYDAFNTPSATPSSDSNCLVYNYTEGLITRISDPLGQVVEQEWYSDRTGSYPDPVADPASQANFVLPSVSTALTADSPGGYRRSLKRVKDKRGLVTHLWYDSRGNLVLQKVTGELTGDGVQAETRVTRNTYTAEATGRSLLLTTQSSVDNESGVVNMVVTTTYGDGDYPYLPTEVSRSVGGTVISRTNLSYTESGAASVQARGLLATCEKLMATGATKRTRMEYDSRGFLTKQIDFAEKTLSSTPSESSNAADKVANFRYNYRAELVQEWDSGNRLKGYSYDDMGRLVRSTIHAAAATGGTAGPLVSASSIYYNLNGEVSWVDGPRGGPEDYTFFSYDADGRRIAEVRWRSRAKADGSGVESVSSGDDLSSHAVSEFEYDAFDNLTKKIDPNGNYVVFSYDAIGQLRRSEAYEAKTGRLLSIEELFREPGGEVSRSINAAGGETKFFYTADGKIRRQENPDGSVLEWRYTLDGRLKEEILPHLAKWVTSYDDVARKVTRKYHGPPSAGASGALLATETRLFDALGNVLSATDVDGYAVITNYDALSRPTSVTGPAAAAQTELQTSSLSYDLKTLTTVVSNAKGEQTRTQRDALNRPTRIEVKSAAPVALQNLVTYDYAADQNSVTVSKGDGTSGGFISSNTTFTDTFGNPVLTHLHRTSQARDVTRNIYDLGGRLVESIDPRGQATRLTYDGAGRIECRSLPDGSETRFAYDSAGNLIKRVMPGGLVWTGFYDSSARLVSEELIGSDQSRSRKFDYTYYDSGLHIGLPYTSRDLFRGVTTTASAYDEFRRSKTLVVTATGALRGLSQSYEYNKRGHLTRQTQDYADPSLPDSEIVRQFDGYGQLTREQVLVDGVTRSTVDQHWDSAGRRKRLDGDIGASGTVGQRFAYLYRADGLLGSVTEKVTGQNRLFEFTYDNSGQLLSRANPWRTQTVTARDHQGRILNSSSKITGQPAAFLQETLTWREDGLMSGYASVRSGSWSQNRSYTYNVRGQLVEETYSPSSGASASVSYAFDQHGLGVRTSARPSATTASQWQVASGGLDSFFRTIHESLGVPSTISAFGYASGAGSVQLNLTNLDDNLSTPVHGVSYNSASQDGRWEVDLDLSAGSYELQAKALSRDGADVSVPAVSRFAVDSDSSPRIFTDYDKAGYAVQRRWSTQRRQRFVWDVLGRLLQVDDYGDGQAGRRWTAVYDCAGRRIEARTDPLTPSGGLVSGSRVTEKSLYDPQVEFLELAVSIGSTSNPTGQTFWKVYGPDLNGAYGSLQGIGGLEATIRQSDGQVSALINDVWGHGIAAIAGSPGSSPIWSGTQVSGYGPLPGQTSKILGVSDSADTTTQLASATVWRGHRIDSTGFYYLGARYYEPLSGRFLSPDPMGHGASMSLYDYANGDPINFFDPDGRLAKSFYAGGLGVVQGSSNFFMQGWAFLATSLAVPPMQPGYEFVPEVIQAYESRMEVVMNFHNEYSGQISRFFDEPFQQITPNGFNDVRSTSGGYSEAVWAVGTMAEAVTNVAKAMRPSVAPDPVPQAGYKVGPVSAPGSAAFNPANFADDVARIRAESLARYGPGEGITAMAAENAGGAGVLRVRHHTSNEGLAGIRQSETIFPARGDPVGVHVEVGPRFGPAATASAETGAAGRGAYVEFNAPSGMQGTYVGPRQTAVIPTNTPLPINQLNPVYVSKPWWKFW